MNGNCEICGEPCEIKMHRTYILCAKCETLSCAGEDLKKAMADLNIAIKMELKENQFVRCLFNAANLLTFGLLKKLCKFI